MPFNPMNYGAGWREFSGTIRFHRARGQCECVGECGRHRAIRCTERHREPGKHQRGTVVITTAHLCACDPPCQNARHVKAMCNKCHLRVDIPRHQATRRRKQLAADALRRSAASVAQSDPSA